MVYDIGSTEAYIRQAAAARGIDPDIAVRVARSEGLAKGVYQSRLSKNGTREPSFGPFQLLVGGQGTNYPAGMGNDFINQTGLDPRDPATVPQQVDFALDNAARNGWGAWYGAAKVGVGKRDGIGGAAPVGSTFSGQGGSDMAYGGAGNDDLSGAMPQQQGGLGGLGGFFSSPGVTDAMQAIGMSMMSSPRNNWLQNTGRYLPGIQDRRERINEGAADRETMMSALTMAGMSPEQAQQFAGNPKAAAVAMGVLDQQRADRLKQQEMSANRDYLASLGGGMSDGGTMPMPADAGAAPAPSGNRLLSPGAMAESIPAAPRQEAQAGPTPTGNRTFDYLAQQRQQVVRQLQAAPSDEAFQRGKLVLDDIDKRLEQYAPTATMREYEYAVSQGYDGGLADWVSSGGKGGTTVNVGQSEYGTIPQGFQLSRDDAGNLTMAPIPGGPEDKSRVEAAAAGNRQTSTDIVTTAAQRARDALNAEGMPATGTIGRVLAPIAESNSAELRRQTQVLQATAKIDNLQAMRAASPTGGALGAVSDKESEMLAAKSGALDPSSPNFLRDLEDYERTLLRVIHGPEAGDAIYEQTRGGNAYPANTANGNRTSSGISWSVE